MEKENIKPLDVFDFDGVITERVLPEHDNCIIITGRCYDESDYVYSYLIDNNILKSNGKLFPVYFNTITLEKRGKGIDKSRIISGEHKFKIIKEFLNNEIEIGKIFEDDSIQYEIITNNLKDKFPISFKCIEIIKVESEYVSKYIKDFKEKEFHNSVQNWYDEGRKAGFKYND